MGEPVTHLTPELVREHAVLADFTRFLSEHGVRDLNPNNIEVNYERPNDGIVLMNYLDTRTRTIYVAQLDAAHGLMNLRVGRNTRVVRGETRTDWQAPEARPYSGDTSPSLCTAVRTLGGDMEQNAPCLAAGSPSPVGPSGPVPFDPGFGARYRFQALALTGQWSFLELIFKRHRRGSVSWAQDGQVGATTALGLLGYNLGSGTLGDAFGLTPGYHTYERRALGAGLGYGMYRGAHYLLSRRFPNMLPASSFAASILGGTLVDSVLQSGGLYHDSISSIGAYGIGFFYPQIIGSAMGPKPVNLFGVFERRAAEGEVLGESALAWNRRLGGWNTGVRRWGGRAVLAAFAADAAYMGINYLSTSSGDSARANRIYGEATRRQQQDLGFFGNVGHGIAHFLMPSITEHYLVGSSYVDSARADLRAEASGISGASEPLLRNALLMGAPGESLNPDFYTSVHYDALRGENVLRNVRRSDGRELPVEQVYEQLSDPAIYRRIVEGSSLDAQISYVQRQFRGFRLSREDVTEIFGRIALFRTRRALGELGTMVSASDNPLAGVFDSNGALRTGQEQALLDHCFAGETVNTDRLLELRRVALAVRILQLRDAGPHGADSLASYSALAQRIGLMDASGNFNDRPEIALARGEYQRLVAALPPAPPRPAAPTQADAIRDFAASFPAHG